MKVEGVFNRIDEEFLSHLREIREELRVDNTITNPGACSSFCQRLKGEIQRLGGHASVVDYGDLPAVVGRIDAGAARTLLVYKNYDIVPAEPANWIAPPFSASVLDLEGIGEAVVARGSAEPKGPLLAFLKALDAIRSAGEELPVNLVLLFEGDEQIGSPTLPKILRDRKAELSRVNGALIPKFSQSYPGVPVIPLGFKGMLLLELICSGGRWGGPTKVSLHSSNAAWIGSPAWRLVQALSTLVTEDEQVTVEGFYDDIVHAIDEEESVPSTLAGDMVEYLRANHVIRFQKELPDAALFRRYLLRPTFNISNLLIHPSTIWSKFVLPSEARAWIDIRLVPDMHPDRIVSAIRGHLSVMGYGDIEVVTHIAYPPWRIAEEDPLVQTMRKVYRRFGLEPETHPSSGTSQPVYVFRDLLGVPLVVGGLGTGGKAFHENEYASVEGMKLFEKSMVEFLGNFALGQVPDVSGGRRGPEGAKV